MIIKLQSIDPGRFGAGMELSVKRKWNKYCEETEVVAEESRKNQVLGKWMREKLWGRQLNLRRESWRSGVET